MSVAEAGAAGVVLCVASLAAAAAALAGLFTQRHQLRWWWVAFSDRVRYALLAKPMLSTNDVLRLRQLEQLVRHAGLDDSDAALAAMQKLVGQCQHSPGAGVNLQILGTLNDRIIRLNPGDTLTLNVQVNGAPTQVVMKALP